MEKQELVNGERSVVFRDCLSQKNVLREKRSCQAQDGVVDIDEREVTSFAALLEGASNRSENSLDVAGGDITLTFLSAVLNEGAEEWTQGAVIETKDEAVDGDQEVGFEIAGERRHVLLACCSLEHGGHEVGRGWPIPVDRGSGDAGLAMHPLRCQRVSSLVDEDSKGGRQNGLKGVGAGSASRRLRLVSPLRCHLATLLLTPNSTKCCAIQIVALRFTTLRNVALPTQGESAMKLTRTSVFLSLFAMALIVSACSSDDAATDSTADTTAAEAETSAEPGDDAFTPGVLDSGATVATFDEGEVKVHTYTNPEAGFGNSTIVVETENAVVLIDSHFAESSASEFRAFAESFGKPIERLILTHDHPDHIGGVEPVFGDVETYSSAGVVSGAAGAGTTIKNTLDAGTVEIDGVEFVFDVFVDAEAEEQVVISVPEAGLVAAGDLIYHQYHAVMTPTFDNWISILEQLAAADDVRVVVPGHGAPGGPEVFDDIIGYLETARSTYAESDDAESFNAAMVDTYPDRAGANLLEFGSDRLFPKS